MTYVSTDNSIRLRFNKKLLYIFFFLQFLLFNILILLMEYPYIGKLPILPYILLFFQIVGPFLFLFVLINFYRIFFDEYGIRLEVLFFHVDMNWSDITSVSTQIGMYRIKAKGFFSSYAIPRAFVYENKDEISEFICKTLPPDSPLRKVWTAP